MHLSYKQRVTVREPISLHHAVHVDPHTFLKLRRKLLPVHSWCNLITDLHSLTFLVSMLRWTARWQTTSTTSLWPSTHRPMSSFTRKFLLIVWTELLKAKSMSFKYTFFFDEIPPDAFWQLDQRWIKTYQCLSFPCVWYHICLCNSFSFLFLIFGATQRSLRRQAQDVRKAVEGGSTEGILSFDDIGPNITHHFLVRKPKNILLCHRSSSRNTKFTFNPLWKAQAKMDRRRSIKFRQPLCY